VGWFFFPVVAQNILTSKNKQNIKTKAPPMNSIWQITKDIMQTGSVNEALMRGGGLLTKMLQMGNSTDASHASFSDARPLNVDATDRLFREYIEQPHIRRQVASFEPSAFKRGSVAQVYRVTLVGGREVCCKVPYAGLEARMREQLALLTKMAWAARVAGYHSIGGTDNEMRDMILAECDLAQERANHEKAEECFRQLTCCCTVPELRPSLCTDKVLCVDFMHGTPLAAFVQQEDAPPRDCTQVLEHVARFVFHGLAWHRFLYTDVHFGNFFVQQPGNRVGVIDFGSIKYFTTERWAAVLRAVVACTHWEQDTVSARFEALGIRLPAEPDRTRVLAGLKGLFSPITHVGPFTYRQAWLDDIRALVYGEVGKKIVSPPDVMWLFRVFFGIASLGVALRATADLHALSSVFAEALAVHAPDAKKEA
jgi:predicted unusual protein kinase regulating ubiquinone biosynthesis (AarF/ABC1/UbiB family)